jgi:hypothetical protein
LPVAPTPCLQGADSSHDRGHRFGDNGSSGHDIGNTFISASAASGSSNLSSAFGKLVADLGGTTADTSSGADASSAGSSALKSFLTSFLQDLAGGAGGSVNSVGTTLNVTA